MFFVGNDSPGKIEEGSAPHLQQRAVWGQNRPPEPLPGEAGFIEADPVVRESDLQLLGPLLSGEKAPQHPTAHGPAQAVPVDHQQGRDQQQPDASAQQGRYDAKLSQGDEEPSHVAPPGVAHIVVVGELGPLQKGCFVPGEFQGDHRLRHDPHSPGSRDPPCARTLDLRALREVSASLRKPSHTVRSPPCIFSVPFSHTTRR